jgi:hypothetical protein
VTQVVFCTLIADQYLKATNESRVVSFPRRLAPLRAQSDARVCRGVTSATGKVWQVLVGQQVKQGCCFSKNVISVRMFFQQECSFGRKVVSAGMLFQQECSFSRNLVWFGLFKVRPLLKQ